MKRNKLLIISIVLPLIILSYNSTNANTWDINDVVEDLSLDSLLFSVDDEITSSWTIETPTPTLYDTISSTWNINIDYNESNNEVSNLISDVLFKTTWSWVNIDPSLQWITWKLEKNDKLDKNWNLLFWTKYKITYVPIDSIKEKTVFVNSKKLSDELLWKKLIFNITWLNKDNFTINSIFDYENYKEIWNNIETKNTDVENKELINIKNKVDQVLQGILEINENKNKKWELLYWAKYKIKDWKWYLFLNSKKLTDNLVWKEVIIEIKWTNKDSFKILSVKY